MTSGVGEFIQYRRNVRNGWFYCGDSTEKGRTVVIKNTTNTDKLSRYSDRYITSRRIGNTSKDYPYFSDLLGNQILTFIGAKSPVIETQPEKPVKGTTANIDTAVLAADDGEDGEIDREDEENEAVEDEFEEFDDDDYNAEKYFDDGDGDGDVDDGGEPDYS